MNKTTYVTNTSRKEDLAIMQAKQEHLRHVKDVAITLLHFPVRICTDDDGMKEIQHPIFPYHGIIHAPEDREQSIYSIMDNDAAIPKTIRMYKDSIEKMKNIGSVVRSVNKPCRLQFLYLIQNELSPDEMGKLLSETWTRISTPYNRGVPLPAIVKWFKKASRQSLMVENELAYYDSLPDEFTVYRGIGPESNKNGLSYTLSLDEAERFANPYQNNRDNGYVLTGTAKKKDVLACLYGLTGPEILIEPKNIADLHKMQVK